MAENEPVVTVLIEGPGAGPVSTKIIVPFSARVFAFLKMLLAFYIAFLALGLATIQAERIDTDFSWLRYLGILVAAVLLPLAVLSGWSNMRSAFARKARLEVLPDRLAIYHGGVFRSPTAVARTDILAVDFDARPARFRRYREHKRFPLVSGQGAEVVEREPRFLYSRVSGSPLPVLGQVTDVPNVAILFTEPKLLRPIRRWQKAFPSKVRSGPPLHKRNSRGLLARVKDVEAMRNAMGTWGVERPITWEDIDEHAPQKSDRKKARRLTWRDNAILFIIIGSQAAIPLALADPQEETPSPAIGVCGRIDDIPHEPIVGGSQSSSDSLGSLLPDDIGPTYTLVNDEITDIDVVSQEGAHIGNTREHLEAEHMERAYFKRWIGPGGGVFATVLEFPDASNAVDYETYSEGATCSIAGAAYGIADIPNAIGFQIGALERVTMVVGRRRYLVDVYGDFTLPPREDVLSIARMVADSAG